MAEVRVSPLVMIKLPAKIRFEQAVYGSFPFWNRGYSLLCRSQGCRPEWLGEMPAVCQRYGEPPTGVTEADSVFALQLKSGPWMIVGVHPQGLDDHDRPGATAFHALFVGSWAYRWAGADPFVFTGAMRREWSLADQDRRMPTGVCTLGAMTRIASSNPAADIDPRVPLIVSALTEGRRVVVQSLEPIDGLARSVWTRLSHRVRNSTSVATWAFDNANNFDLVALPKLAGVVLNPRDLVIAVEHAGR
jgi:hypothetical protein